MLGFEGMKSAGFSAQTGGILAELGLDAAQILALRQARAI